MKHITVNGKPLSQMSLGTVQLGMNYGIANDQGQPDTAQSTAMLNCALKNGITSLDTARGYGTSEDVLGNFFKENPQENMPFITSKLRVENPYASAKEIEAEMYTSVETSLKKLGINKLDCLLLHRGPGYTLADYGDAVRNTFARLIKDGYTDMVGASVYDPEEVDEMLLHDIYTATQVPMSLFDQKLITGGYTDRLKEKNIVVFVRSVFLQGVFFLDPDKMTDPLLVEYAKPYILKLREFCDRTGMSVAEFAISFMRDVPGVTSLVLGADTEEQVLQNIAYMNAPTLSADMRREVTEAFSNVDIPKIMEVLCRPKQ
ncbi:MAG: aldo/keto reductase [Ruminococcaceae bacterium]|nr:aldo/keto reductase [Oscillospiraceae bacterium]